MFEIKSQLLEIGKLTCAIKKSMFQIKGQIFDIKSKTFEKTVKNLR